MLNGGGNSIITNYIELLNQTEVYKFLTVEHINTLNNAAVKTSCIKQ